MSRLPRSSDRWRSGVRLPVEAAFGRFKLGPRGNAYPFGDRLRTLLAGPVLDSLAGQQVVPAPSLSHCPCGEMAMAAIASAAGVTAGAGETSANAMERAGKGVELHDFFLDGSRATAALVDQGLRTGAIKRAATAIRRFGAITFCPSDGDQLSGATSPTPR